MNEESQDQTDKFPEEHQAAVDGLLWLGHLENEFKLAGHSFVLRTLKVEEELEVARLCEEFKESIGSPTAFKWAHIALALVSVDGDTDFCPPLGPDRTAYARSRFNYVTQWYAPVGDFLFNSYAELTRRQTQALEAIENLSPRSPIGSMPWEDSLTEVESSEEVST